MQNSTKGNNSLMYYTLSVFDDSIATNEFDTYEFGGPYFKITEVSKKIDYSNSYELVVGFPTINIIKDISISDSENYALFYDYTQELHNEEYVERLDPKTGEWIQEYAPIISSRNSDYRTRTEDTSWWNKVSAYPIKTTVRIKGLLKPIILMQYIKLKILYFGKPYIDSGLYIVTEQIDDVGTGGYTTTLSLTRIDSISQEEM